MTSGGSHGGQGGLGLDSNAVNNVFDSFLAPVEFGGGAMNPGGGVIKVTATSIVVHGVVSAK